MTYKVKVIYVVAAMISSIFIAVQWGVLYGVLGYLCYLITSIYLETGPQR